MSGEIFLSYRRADTADATAVLYDRLAAHFGHTQVFKDVDSMKPGDLFPREIANAVASCDVLLAVIGNRWLTSTDQHGARRLDNLGDLVRLEIETALQQDDVVVVPVLVDGAEMPAADELPASLTGLAGRHARPLRASRFDADVARLLEALDERLSTGGPGRQELSDAQSAAAADLLLARAAEQIGSQVKVVRKMGLETLKDIIAQWPRSPRAQAIPEMLAGFIVDHAPWTPDEQAKLVEALGDEGTWSQPWPTTSGGLPLPPWIAQLRTLNVRAPDVLAALEGICRLASERPLDLTLDEVDLRKLNLGEDREATKLRGVRFNNAHFEGS